MTATKSTALLRILQRASQIVMGVKINVGPHGADASHHFLGISAVNAFNDSDNLDRFDKSDNFGESNDIYMVNQVVLCFFFGIFTNLTFSCQSLHPLLSLHDSSVK